MHVRLARTGRSAHDVRGAAPSRHGKGGIAVRALGMSWKKSDPGSPAPKGACEPKHPPDRSGAMDDGEMRAQMEETERRVAEAERLANRQRTLVASLVRGGQDAAEARRLLRILEERLALEEADRDRTRRELAALKRR
jgi:hypothetical protein